MKKFIFFVFVLCVGLLDRGYADLVRDSGISVEDSKVFLENFSPMEGSANLSGCSITESGITFQELAITASDSPETIWEKTLTNSCFQSSGTYTVRFEIVDRAGNSAPASNHTFTIWPSDPVMGDITSTPSFSSGVWAKTTPSAEDDTTFSVQYDLVDRFGNKVIQIGSSNISFSEEPTVNYNSNEDGLMITKFNDSGVLVQDNLSVNAGTITFDISSYAPSLKKWGKVVEEVSWPVSFAFDVPDITDRGEVSSTTQTLAEEHLMKFKAPYVIVPDAEQEVDLNGQMRDIAFLNEESCDGEGNCSYAPDKNASLFFKPQGEDGAGRRNFSGTYDIDNLDNYLRYEDNLAPESNNTWTKKIIKKDTFTRSLAEDEDYPLSLRVLAEYTPQPGITIKYPMGASGLKGSYPNPNLEGTTPLDFSTRNDDVRIESINILGYHDINGREWIRPSADIEGGVIGKISDPISARSYVQVMQDHTPRDIREKMVENGWRLVREAKSTCLATNSSQLSSQLGFSGTCDVVVVKNQNITIPPDNFSLSGHKTLIIVDGNLIIDEDFTYDMDQHSFGVILLNSKIKSYPLTGNILIGEDVQHIQGNFYAEGGIMSYNLDSLPSFSLSNANSPLYKKQLFLEGTLLSSNTLGATNNQNYPTPWESSTTNGDGFTSFQKARAYDLHKLRHGIPGDSGFAQIVTEEDHPPANPRSFVIRLRPPVTPPPGFAW